MLDINGRMLAVEQTVVVASKDSGPNVPVLKKGVIEDLQDGSNAYIKVRYSESGRLSTIDGYMYITHKRFCII